jgi:hypothetical protein
MKMQLLLLSVSMGLAASQAHASMTCSGYLYSSNPLWQGNYEVTIGQTHANVRLTDTYGRSGSYSLTIPKPTPHGTGFQEADYPAFWVTNDQPYGAPAGISVSVATGPGEATYLGRLTACNYF